MILKRRKRHCGCKVRGRKTLSFLLAALLCAAQAGMTLPSFAADDGGAGPERSPQSGAYSGYIFKIKDDAVSEYSYKEDIALYDASAGSEDLSDTGITRLYDADGLYRAADLDDIKDFADEDDIEYVEPDYIRHMYDDVSESGGPGMTADVAKPQPGSNNAHLELMKVPAAWEYGLRGEDTDMSLDMSGNGDGKDPIVIGVIDSGLAEGHEDIDYTHVLPGANFASASGGSTADTQGHGTFVTGQILASADNGKGIDGIAEDVYVMPLKVFMSQLTSDSIIINAVNYATEQKKLYKSSKGADGANICVLNMSLGDAQSSSAVKTAIDAATAEGIIVISAAGNDGDTTASYPAQYSIGVGSTNSAGTYSVYSQVISASNGSGYENKVWVTAPGEGYTSLWYNGRYYSGSGTSFSAPEVSALAAVALSVKNDLTDYYKGTELEAACSTNQDAFRQLLKETSDYKNASADLSYSTVDRKAGSQDIYYGWGIVNFENMIERLAVLSENNGKPSAISFNVTNGAGSAITAEKNGLEIKVYKSGAAGSAEDADIAEGTEIVPDNGVYTLTIGQKYDYTISADKYKTYLGSITPVTEARAVSVVLAGNDYFTSFNVMNADGEPLENAEIKVARASGDEVERNADGSFTTQNGNYAYDVSAEGYLPQTGAFVIDDSINEYNDDKNTVNVTLRSAADICSVKLDVTGSDGEPQAQVFLYNSVGQQVMPYSDGAWKLEPGEYRYDVESDYYRTTSGTFSVSDSDKGTEKTFKIRMQYRLYLASFVVTPSDALGKEGAAIEVKNSEGQKVEPFNRTDFRIVSGKYSYTVTVPGYKTASGTFNAYGESVSIPVALEADEAGSGGSSSGGSGGSGSSSGGGSGSSGGSGGSGGTGSSGGSSGGPAGGGSGSSSGTVSAPSTQTDDGGARDYSAVYDIETIYHNMSDVANGAWYYEAVNYCLTAGIFTGASDDAFKPEGSMTRAMTAAVLYRLSGETVSADDAQPFKDVASDAYYSDAVKWAYKNKIITGTAADAFSPDKEISREQMITMLYRYAEYAKKSTAAGGSEAAEYFSDYTSVSSYAADAVQWAYINNIAKGDDRRCLSPEKSVKRCEAASMMSGFVKNILCAGSSAS